MATLHPSRTPAVHGNRFSRTSIEFRAAEAVVVHGVLMSVCGRGVLLVGDPGRGKSSLALALLRRGHALVADDAPEIGRLEDGSLMGRCPDSIFGWLHTRQDGFVDIQLRFGAESVRQQCRVDVIIALSGIDHFRRLPMLQALIDGAARCVRVLFLPTLICDDSGAINVERALAEN